MAGFGMARQGKDVILKSKGKERERMKTRRYEVKLTGQTPLLMHGDNLSWDGYMAKWLMDPKNKELSKAGDDRTPAWKWIGYLYIEQGLVVVPSDNLMTVIREAGTMLPTGKGKKTFKRQSQNGIVVDQLGWPVLVNGKTIPYDKIEPLLKVDDYLEHEHAAKQLGFELFAKRVKIGRAKHVRVRPRFDRWACSGTISVTDDMITTNVVRDLFLYAGDCGLCDWRNSSPDAPGAFGKFSAIVKEI